MRRGMEAAAFALATFFLYTRVHARPHVDTARDLLLARDCAQGIVCHFQGPPASFGRFVQGATWIHLLEAILAGHAGIVAAERVVWGLAALSVAGFYLLARSAASTWAAVLTTIAYALAAPWFVAHPDLWNPSLLPMATVLFVAALRAFARAPRWPVLAALALAFAVLVDLHLVALLLAPVVAAAAIALPPRRFAPLRLAGCAALVVATLWLSSRSALAIDVREVSRHPVPATGGATVLAAVTAVLAARWWRAATPDRVTFDAVVAYTGAIVVGSLSAGASVAPRYFVPIVPGAGLLLAVAIDRWCLPATIATAASIAYFAGGRVADLIPQSADPATAWTLADAERCAERLAARGWTAHGAVRSLDAPGGRAFVSVVSAFLPLGREGDAPPHALVVRRGDTCDEVPAPIVDASRGERCIDGTCAALRPAYLEHTPPVPDYSSLAYPRRWELVPEPKTGRYVVAYVLPLVGGAATSASVAAGELHSRWTVERRDESLVLARTVEMPWDDDGWPPAVLP